MRALRDVGMRTPLEGLAVLLRLLTRLSGSERLVLGVGVGRPAALRRQLETVVMVVRDGTGSEACLLLGRRCGCSLCAGDGVRKAKLGFRRRIVGRADCASCRPGLETGRRPEAGILLLRLRCLDGIVQRVRSCRDLPARGCQQVEVDVDNYHDRGRRTLKPPNQRPFLASPANHMFVPPSVFRTVV